MHASWQTSCTHELMKHEAWWPRVTSCLCEINSFKQEKVSLSWSIAFTCHVPLSFPDVWNKFKDFTRDRRDSIQLWSRLRVLDPRNWQSMETAWEAYKVCQATNVIGHVHFFL